ncbi:unnamed protein product [Gongylonema pulchrum]|uniref:Uncharacterized protein n=1 Tax=Gongylonema pulchrum TaxID=637853 RepID=A0A183EIG7_9BILA|nr:unnamed protein product [Gongylonema pulchrum]
MDEKAPVRQDNLIHSLRTKIWLTAVKINSDYWKKVKKDDLLGPTVYVNLLDRIVAYDQFSDERKLELLPNVDEIIECLLDLGSNKVFAVMLRAAEETARRTIVNAGKIVSAD